jgi:hypothetical protein
MFPGRLAIQQRLLPGYRVPFFEHLARGCRDGLALFAGEPAPWEGVQGSDAPPCDLIRFHKVEDRHLLHGRATWQPGFRQWLSAERPDTVIIEANARVLSTYRGVCQLRHEGIPVIGWGSGLWSGIRRG